MEQSDCEKLERAHCGICGAALPLPIVEITEAVMLHGERVTLRVPAIRAGPIYLRAVSGACGACGAPFHWSTSDKLYSQFIASVQAGK